MPGSEGAGSWQHDPATDQNRAVATRYDKRAAIFDGTVQVVSIRIWLRDLIRSTNSA